MRCYFIRHARTAGNEQGFFPDREEPLSERGQKEAQLVAERLKVLELDAILSSPAKRTQETAAAIGSAKGLAPEVRSELVELERTPDLHGKHRHDPAAHALLDEWWDNADNPEWRLPEGESFFDFQKRTQTLLEQLEQGGFESVAIVSHSFTLRMLFSLIVFGEDLLTSEMFKKISFRFKLSPTGITVADYSPQKGWKVLIWNDTAHLGDAVVQL